MLSSTWLAAPLPWSVVRAQGRRQPAHLATLSTTHALRAAPSCVLQAQLEEVLFSIVREKGFDEAHIDCYRMVTQFYQSRQPLCIIICGASWTGGLHSAKRVARSD